MILHQLHVNPRHMPIRLAGFVFEASSVQLDRASSLYKEPL